MIASGGVGNISDLELLARVAAPNVEGAIVGRALYERRFTVAEGNAALACALGEVAPTLAWF